MKKILVLCFGNSCRSQMAEGYLRFFAGNACQIYSAGIETHGVNPLAIEVMKEDGIDISGHTSNHIEEYKDIAFDFVITVCDHAQEQCPLFLTTGQKFHTDLPDPAKAIGRPAELAIHFRQVRQMIKAYCKTFAKEHLG